MRNVNWDGDTTDRVDVEALKRRVDFPTLASHWLELHRVGNTYTSLCPFHEDNDPSFRIYSDHAFCFGCETRVDAISLVMRMEGLRFMGAVRWLEAYIGAMPTELRLAIRENQIAPDHPLPHHILEYWHGLVTSEIRDYYYWRMLTDHTIDLHMLGWDGWNYVVPVWEGLPQASDVFGVRFRRSDNEEPRYFGMKGRNQARLYNKGYLEGAEEAYVFIGEFDALLASQDGFAAVSPTAGQGSWKPGWSVYFEDVQRIYVVPDQGEFLAGCKIASHFGDRATIVRFPPNTGKDYTEFRQQGHDRFDFLALVEAATQQVQHINVDTFWEKSVHASCGI